MPILKSAKKALKQSLVKRTRNYKMRRALKDGIKEVVSASKAGKAKDPQALLSQAYKVIDTAAKKNIIHKKNADRKKAKMSQLIAGLSKKSEPKA